MVTLIKRNKIGIFIGLFLLIFVIGGAVYSSEEEITLELDNYSEEILPRQSNLDIMVASDLHYLSPELMEEGLLYDSLLNDGDGKLTHYSEDIIDAFVDEVIEKNPELLIISGDLTFDGEKKSHLELADKLNRIIENDIQVSVIPGNHDVNVYSARGFTEDSTYWVDSVSAEEFEEIYEDLGYSSSISRDSRSLSYVTALSEDTWIIMLDSNKYREHNQHRKSVASGVIQEETMEWLEFVLKKSAEYQVKPIVVAHHNFLNHHSRTSNGFTLDNDRDVVKLLKEYNVPLTFSGHIHLQHIAQDGDFYDIASGSLSVYPNYVGHMTINPKENELSYEKKRLNMNPSILDYSEEFFNEVSRRKVLSQLHYFELDDHVLEKMTDTFVQFNNAYFAGTVHEEYDSIKENEGFSYWETISGIGYVDYMMHGLEENGQDGNKLKLQLRNHD